MNYQTYNDWDTNREISELDSKTKPQQYTDEIVMIQ